MQNRMKANLTLATCAICAAGTLPSVNPSGGIFLGLLNHGFIAATIGGLADWFAVTALFRKPLGISYRTEILKRNRQHISDAIVEFVSEDLLKTENIMDTVREENTARLLIDFFENYSGRDKTKELVREILAELFMNLDSEKISRSIAPIVEAEIKNFDAKKILDAAVKVTTDEKHARRILTALFETARKIIKSKHMQAAIFEKIVELRQAYEGDSAGRALVLASMNLTDEKILSILNENVEEKISAAVDALQSRRIFDAKKDKVAQDLISAFRRTLENATAQIDAEKFQAEFQKLFNGKIDAAGYIKSWMDKNVKGESIWRASVDALVDRKIDEFIGDEAQQEKFDRIVKNMIEAMVNEYHGEIPALIREKLDRFSDDELNEFVETRVEDDLQMIRINGSVCGGIVGMILYVATLIIGQIG